MLGWKSTNPTLRVFSYSARKASKGFNRAAFIAGMTPAK